MFAEINVKLLEPTVVYLDEKPPKILKSKMAPKKGKRTKKMRKKENITKKKKVKISQKSSGNVAIKKEQQSTDNETVGQSVNTAVIADDPLYTPDKEIKIDLDIDRAVDAAESFEYKFSEEVNKYSDNEQHNDDTSTEDDEEYERKLEEDDEEDCEFDDKHNDSDEAYCEDDDDESSIMHTRSRGRPRKYSYIRKSKKPRLEKCRGVCKQQCTQKFNEEQRRSMCDLFWSLSKEEKREFIRTHIRKKRRTRLERGRTNVRGASCSYYLDSTDSESSNLVRVCRKYFENTLCISSYTIKQATEGYEPEHEFKMLMDQRKESEKESKDTSAEVQQLLDPVTGNLITIDPKAKKTNSKTTTPKKKRVRRKPGDPAPEHNPKPINCAERCIHKCHTKFTEEERKKICDIFWSMDYKRRKDFILARIETRDVETETMPEFRKTNRPPRAYHTRFFLRSGINGENVRVCKNFLMNTLSITRMFITNAIDFADKNTGCYTGEDMRGKHLASQYKLASARKQIILDHIGSYPTWIPNKTSKSRYLHFTLNIKSMYSEYKEMCNAEERKPLSLDVYYRTFHKDFSLYFLRNPEPQKGRGFINLNPNISHYTGEESGGMWLDPKGGKLDIKLHDPAKSFIQISRPKTAPAASSVSHVTAASSGDTASISEPQPLGPGATSFSFNPSLSYAHLIDPTLNPSFIRQPPTSELRQDFNPNVYDNNLSQAHIASTSSLFRRL